MNCKNFLGRVRISVFLISVLLFIGCETPISDSAGPEVVTSPYETISWQDDGTGYIRWYTNDPQYISDIGYSEWEFYDPVQTPMTSVEVEVKKVSGDPYMGYGIVFCLQDGTNYLTVNIDTLGFYRIAKYSNGSSTDIVSWMSSDYLFQGYGVKNTIQVDYNSTNAQFTLSFNGSSATTFKDTSATPFSDGRSGFLIGVSDTENFPDEPVDVRFRRLQP